MVLQGAAKDVKDGQVGVPQGGGVGSSVKERGYILCECLLRGSLLATIEFQASHVPLLAKG